FVHFINPTNPADAPTDIQGVLAFNGFPITKMIVGLNDATGTNIGSGDAVAAMATLTGTCTASTNCTVLQWVATSGSVNVTPSGSPGGPCQFYSTGGLVPLTCHTQHFNISFDLTEPNPLPHASAEAGALHSQTI